MAFTLMICSKTGAAELRMITRDFIEMIKHQSYNERTFKADQEMKCSFYIFVYNFLNISAKVISLGTGKFFIQIE